MNRRTKSKLIFLRPEAFASFSPWPRMKAPAMAGTPRLGLACERPSAERRSVPRNGGTTCKAGDERAGQTAGETGGCDPARPIAGAPLPCNLATSRPSISQVLLTYNQPIHGSFAGESTRSKRSNDRARTWCGIIAQPFVGLKEAFLTIIFHAASQTNSFPGSGARPCARDAASPTNCSPKCSAARKSPCSRCHLLPAK